MAEAKICAVEGCGKPVKGLGYCNNHYFRFHKHGDPLAGRAPKGEPIRFVREIALKHSGDACLPWPYARRSDGGGVIQVGRKSIAVSRFVCQLAHGEPPTPEHQAAHSCGQGHEACVSPIHLRWATRVENEADKFEHGTRVCGERHLFAKLTQEQVDRIRSQRGRKRHCELAREFGVTPSTISMIQAGKTWV